VIVSIKANCIDSTAAPAAVFAMEVDKLVSSDHPECEDSLADLAAEERED
jgi:fibrillarin-like rRNA methylase